MRQHGTITRYDGRTGIIQTDETELFFRADNVMRFCTVTVGDGVTFSVRPNTAYDGGMDLAMHIVTDGTSLPLPRAPRPAPCADEHAAFLARQRQLKAQRDADKQARIEEADKRLRAILRDFEGWMAGVI